MKTTFIYFLKDPENPNKGYVGKTDNPITRLPKHISECRNKKHYRANWLKSLAARGLKPTLEIVDEVPFEHWKQLEVAYIEFFLEQGYELTNSTPGGEDPPILRGKNHPNVIRPPSAETCEKISAARRGTKRSPESCAKQSASVSGEKHHSFGKKRSPEFCAKISAALKGKKQSTERRTEQSSRMSGDKNPFFGKKHTPESCEKISAARTGRKLSPEHCAKIGAKSLGRRHSPKTKAKQSAARMGKKHKHNTSGFVGITWNKKSEKWQATFQLARKQIHVGLFVKIEDAVFARALAIALL